MHLAWRGIEKGRHSAGRTLCFAIIDNMLTADEQAAAC
jgi:hypothetical protein